MGEVKREQRRRPYHSPLREESARRTRRAIVLAAGELFTARGYTGASLDDVAAAARVSRPTVFAAIGSKPALLREVLDQALAGDDEPVPVAERPWFRPIWDAATHSAVLDAYANVCTLIGSRAARMFEVVRRAADTSPEAAEVWATLQTNRRAGAAMVVAQLERLEPLGDHRSADRATDVLWVYNDPAHYAALVLECGWTEASFREWLSAQMRSALTRSVLHDHE